MTPAFKILQSNSNSILNNSKHPKISKVQSIEDNMNDNKLLLKEIQISEINKNSIKNEN
jgi:3-dehydroquinate synthase class II